MAPSKRSSMILQNMMAGLLLTVVALTFGQVMLRLLFKGYLSWGEEVSRFIVIWLTFIGAIYLTQEKAHLSVGIKIQGKLNHRVIALIDVFIDLCMVAVTAVAGYHGAKFVWSTLDYRASSLVWVRMGVVFLPMPTAMAAILYLSVRDLLKHAALVFGKGSSTGVVVRRD